MLIFNSVNTIILSQVSYFLMRVFIYPVGYMYTALTHSPHKSNQTVQQFSHRHEDKLESQWWVSPCCTTITWGNSKSVIQTSDFSQIINSETLFKKKYRCKNCEIVCDMPLLWETSQHQETNIQNMLLYVFGTLDLAELNNLQEIKTFSAPSSEIRLALLEIWYWVELFDFGCAAVMLLWNF